MEFREPSAWRAATCHAVVCEGGPGRFVTANGLAVGMGVIAIEREILSRSGQKLTIAD